MRRIFATAAAVAFTAVGLLTFDASPTEAAVFSVGAPNGSIGNFVCMDVSGNSLQDQTPIIAYDCHAGPNQQFQFASEPASLPGQISIYAEGGHTCVDVKFSGTADGTIVWSYHCNGTGAQLFYYDSGQIVNVNSGKCLDAGDMANGTQLVIRTCDPTFKFPSQQWQIK